MAPMARESSAAPERPDESAAAIWSAPPRAAPDGVIFRAPTEGVDVAVVVRGTVAVAVRVGVTRAAGVGALVAGFAGAFVAALVGAFVGAFVGVFAAGFVAALVGALVGAFVGAFVAALVGALVAAFVGAFVAARVGAGVALVGFGLGVGVTAGFALDVDDVVPDTVGSGSGPALSGSTIAVPFGATRVKPSTCCPRGRCGWSFV